MASAKEVIERIVRIDGVSGCLLVRGDGKVLAQTKDDWEKYLTLMADTSKLASEIRNMLGFAYCRHFCFNRENKRHFYVFVVGKYLLGVEQHSDCYIPGMLETIYRLFGWVPAGKPDANQYRSD